MVSSLPHENLEFMLATTPHLGDREISQAALQPACGKEEKLFSGDSSRWGTSSALGVQALRVRVSSQASKPSAEIPGLPGPRVARP